MIDLAKLRARAGALAGAMLLAAGLAALAAGPAQAKWLRAESPRFVVYSDGDETVLRDYVKDLEAFDGVLRSLHGLDANAVPPRKLEVYLVRSREQLHVTYPDASEGIAGFYAPTTVDVLAVAIRTKPSGVSNVTHDRVPSGWALDGQQIVFHEYTHHFMLQYFPYGYPAWLVEGYAEYFGPTVVTPERVEVGVLDEARGPELWSSRWLPLRDVLAKNVSQIERERRTWFYAEAWLLTHYFMSDPERYRQLGRYMAAVGKGADPVKAMEEATGMGVEALEARLHDYVKGKLQYTVFDRRKTAEPPITVTVLPPSADELLLDAAMMKGAGTAKKDEAETVKRIRAEAAHFPGDRLAELTLARAEIEYGDRKAGEAILDRRLAAAPDDVEALDLAAHARLDAGDDDKAHAADLAKEAQPFVAKAFKLDPDRYQTLWTYARSRKLLDPDYPSDNTLEALLAAHDLAPQVEEIRLEAARGMIARGRLDYAAAMLTPVANDPHGGEGVETARKLLAEIERKRAGAAPAAPAPATPAPATK
jgi:hypothetical protein